MGGAGDPGMKGTSEFKLNLIPCGNCEKESSLCCGNCRKESFCSVICQKARRRQHKLICFPGKEEIGEAFVQGVGVIRTDRFWVATRDIETGERIFTDFPLMIGPGQADIICGQEDTGSRDSGQQICLGCHKILQDFVVETDGRKCGDCGWPLCGDACPGIERHRKECEPLCRMREHNNDFESLGNLASRHGVYEKVRSIRLLTLMRDDPVKWESFLNLYIPDILENGISRISALNIIEMENSIRLLKFACRMELTKELLIRLTAVEVFHLRPPHFPKGNKDELVLYDKESRIDISCMENCHFSQIPVSKKIKVPHGIVVIAAKTIKKGERLSRAIGGKPNWDGTKRRRETLMEGDLICKCARCRDPTELGTNVSAIRCRKCKSGLMSPLDPLNDKSKWKCNTVECSRLVPASDVDKLVNQIQMEADALTRTALLELSRNQFSQDRVTKFVEKFEKVLNPHHYILLNAQELSINPFTFMIHQTVRPDKHLSSGLSQKIDGHRRIAGLFLHVGTKVFPSLHFFLVAFHFYMGMSNFFSAQQAVRNEETCDVVQDWLKQGISHRRKVLNLSIKMSFTDNAEHETQMTSLGEAYENALELCRRTPNYSGIPENMFELEQNICTPVVPQEETPTVEKN